MAVEDAKQCLIVRAVEGPAHNATVLIDLCLRGDAGAAAGWCDAMARQHTDRGGVEGRRTLAPVHLGCLVCNRPPPCSRLLHLGLLSLIALLRLSHLRRRAVRRHVVICRSASAAAHARSAAPAKQSSTGLRPTRGKHRAGVRTSCLWAPVSPCRKFGTCAIPARSGRPLKTPTKSRRTIRAL